MGDNSSQALRAWAGGEDRRLSTRTVFLLLLPLVLLYLLFFAVPLFNVVLKSLGGGGPAGLTLDHYRAVAQPVYLQAIGNSLLLAGGTSVLGVIAGSVFGYFIVSSRPGTRKVLLAITSIPLSLSGIVIAYLFIVLLGSAGVVTLSLQKVFGVNPFQFSSYLYSWKGVLIAYLFFQVPRMALLMTGALSNLDRALIEAGDILGARWWQVLWYIVLPALKPALLAGAALLFSVSMGAWATAWALVGVRVNILPLAIYTQISDVSYKIEQANALSVVLVVVTTFAIYLYRRQSERAAK